MAETKKITTDEEKLIEMLSKQTLDMNAIKSFVDEKGLSLSETMMKKFFPERFKPIDEEAFKNVVANLKKYDEEFGTSEFDKFAHGDINGYNPATYLAKRAVVCGRLEEEWADKGDMEKSIRQMKRKDSALKALEILKEADADLSREDANNRSLSKIIKGSRKEPTANRIIPEEIAEYAYGKVKRAYEERLPSTDNNEEGLAVGGISSANQQERSDNSLRFEEDKQADEPQELTGDVIPGSPDENEDEGKGTKKRDWRPIKEKDIIDYLYDDIFLYYLNKALEKVYNWSMGHLDNWAESRKKKTEKIKESAVLEKNESLKKAKLRCAEVLDLKNAFNEIDGSRASRKASFSNIITDIRNNIGKPAQDWQFIKDRTVIDKLNKAYKKEGPSVFANKLNNLEQRREDVLKKDDLVHKLAMSRASLEYVDECLEEKKYDFVDEPVDLGKKFQVAYEDIAKLYDLTIKTAVEVAAVKGMNERDTAKTIAEYSKQFVENYKKYLDDAHEALCDEVKDGQFRANNGASRSHKGRDILRKEPTIESLIDCKKVSTLAEFYDADGKPISKEHKKDLKTAAKEANISVKRENNTPLNKGLLDLNIEAHKKRLAAFKARITSQGNSSAIPPTQRNKNNQGR